MPHEIKDSTENLASLAYVQAHEIRITVKGGAVQGIERGEDVPQVVVITICDYDTESMTIDEVAEKCFLDGDGDYCVFEEI